VVGVVENGKYQSLTESSQSVIFVPMNAVVHTIDDDAGAIGVRRSRWSAGNPAGDRGARSSKLPLYGSGSVEQMLGFVLFPNQVAAVA